jgi:hypothetical protein
VCGGWVGGKWGIRQKQNFKKIFNICARCMHTHVPVK